MQLSLMISKLSSLVFSNCAQEHSISRLGKKPELRYTGGTQYHE